ncbi:Vmc-like lipoprotein signal peptide domain-containing protein [Leucobacter luti]
MYNFFSSGMSSIAVFATSAASATACDDERN